MGKLGLFLADTDEEYVRNLENYIMLHYPQRFEINSFTDPDIGSFSWKDGVKNDILLHGGGFDTKRLPLQSFSTVIRLTDSIPPNKDGYEIFKYRHAEVLISDILRIFSKDSAQTVLPLSQKDTLAVSVFSASGGSGKTSIAAGCSMLSAVRGLRTFYLNLEGVSSARLYFGGTAGRNFSNVIYHLKENDSNLAMRLESAKCVDPGSGVHYFLPPDNSSETDELLPRELEMLLGGLRAACYDVVFIDMPDGAGQRESTMLRASDVIIRVCAANAPSMYKERLMASELNALGGMHPFDFSGRSVSVLNRHCSGNFANDVCGGFDVIINECPGLGRMREGVRLLDLDEDFNSGIAGVFEKVFQEKCGMRQMQGGNRHAEESCG